MPYWMHHGGKRGKKKKSVRTGVRTRLEARELYAESYEDYLAAYQAFLAQLVEPQRSQFLERVRERMEECGQFGLIDDEAQRAELLGQGLLPYTEPNSLVDGIVPADVVKLHGWCMSRRWVTEYAESRAEEPIAPRLFDGQVLTRADLEQLDLLADDYRFINSDRRRTRPMPNQPFIAPAGDDDDDESNSEPMEVPMSPETEEQFQRERAEHIEAETEHIGIILASAETTEEDFQGYLDYEITLETEMEGDPTSNSRGVTYVPVNPENYPNAVYYNLLESEQELATQMIRSFYNDTTAFERSMYGERLIRKLEYLLLQWRSRDDEPYYYSRSEVDEMMYLAVKHKNLALLRLIDRYVTLMPRNPNPGMFTTLQNRINREESDILPNRRRIYAEIRAMIDQYREDANSMQDSAAQNRVRIKVGHLYNLTERIHNLEELEHERERRHEARYYLQPRNNNDDNDDDSEQPIFTAPNRPMRD